MGKAAGGMRTAAALLLAGALGGCAPQAPEAPKEFRYACEGGKSFTTEYAADGQSAVLRFPGVPEPLPLPRALSGSGARYSDGVTTLWIKGRTGFIESGSERTHRGCRTP